MSPRLLRLAALATLAGAFSGLFGVGGGTVIVPLLILWLGYEERTATGTSLAAIAIIAVLAAALAIGFLAGFSSGMLGIGGGILFVPALVFFLDESQLGATASSLVAIVPVAIVGVWRQGRYGNLNLREGLLIGALSVAGVAAGAVLANEISVRALQLAFAGLQLVFA